MAIKSVPIVDGGRTPDVRSMIPRMIITVMMAYPRQSRNENMHGRSIDDEIMRPRCLLMIPMNTKRKKTMPVKRPTAKSCASPRRRKIPRTNNVSAANPQTPPPNSKSIFLDTAGLYVNKKFFIWPTKLHLSFIPFPLWRDFGGV